MSTGLNRIKRREVTQVFSLFVSNINSNVYFIEMKWSSQVD